MIHRQDQDLQAPSSGKNGNVSGLPPGALTGLTAGVSLGREDLLKLVPGGPGAKLESCFRISGGADSHSSYWVPGLAGLFID